MLLQRAAVVLHGLPHSAIPASRSPLGIAGCRVDGVAMIWEIESTEWHMSPADHDRTVAKAAAFVTRGALYLRAEPRMLRLDPAGVIRTLQDAHRHAANRPRPPLTAIRRTAG